MLWSHPLSLQTQAPIPTFYRTFSRCCFCIFFQPSKRVPHALKRNPESDSFYHLDNNDDEDCFPRKFSSDHSDVVVVDGDDEDVRAVLGASEIYCLLRQFLWRQMTAERRRLTNDPLCQIYLSIYSLSCQINSLSLSDCRIKQNTYINQF